MRPYPNIMTMLMLPLAATFSRARSSCSASTAGHPAESYFWRHGSTVQFDEELRGDQAGPPGFFELDYGDYYEQHLVTVERMLLDLEVRGGTRPSAVTPSYMLPLRRRARRRTSRGPVADPQRARTPIVSLTPDWTGDFGHFGPWERAVGPAAASARLSSTGRWPAGPWRRRTARSVPTFTHGTMRRECADLAGSRRSFDGGLDAAAGDGARSCASTPPMSGNCRRCFSVAGERPTSTFVVNLMRSHGLVGELRHDAPSVPVAPARRVPRGRGRNNVHVCLDTTAIVSELETATGIRLPTWPMIMLRDPLLLERTASTRAISRTVDSSRRSSPHREGVPGGGRARRAAER